MQREHQKLKQGTHRCNAKTKSQELEKVVGMEC